MSNKKFIPVANPFLDSKERSAVNFVVKKMDNNGEKVKEFEKNLSKFLNVKYVVAMNNGTSTLDSLVKYFGIKNSSHEVIIPDLTYISQQMLLLITMGK